MDILDTEENKENTLENKEGEPTTPEVTEVEQNTDNIETSPFPNQSEFDEVNDKFTTTVIDFTDQLKENNRISQERELVIDRLHRENQQLKQGELQQALLPIFRDLIKFYDDLDSTISNYSNNPAINDEKILKDLNCYKETVNDILYRYGVEQIETKSGEDFNSKEHKAVATATTIVEEEDRKIAKIIHNGFKTENKLIRNVEVEVYRYLAPIVKKIEEQNENTSEVTKSESEAK